MANYMAEVAKLLGVELGEEFSLDGYESKYRITQNGIETFYQQYKVWKVSNVLWNSLLTGRYTIKKKMLAVAQGDKDE